MRFSVFRSLRVNFRLPSFPVPDGGPPLDAAPVEAIPLPPAEAPLDAPEAPDMPMSPDIAALPLVGAATPADAPLDGAVAPDVSPDPPPLVCEPVPEFAIVPGDAVVLPQPRDHANKRTLVAHVDRAMAMPS